LKSRKRAGAAVLLVLSMLAAAPRAQAVGVERAMDFELRDQFGKPLAYRFPKERVSVLVFGDRKGSEQVEGWVRPVYERYADRVDLHGVAVLTSVPSLFHGYARRQFRKQVKYPVLLDFKGDVSKGYGYEGDKANVFVIARDGTVAYRASGAATPDGLERLYAEVDRLLGARR
jgi:peroxiredoxin